MRKLKNPLLGIFALLMIRTTRINHERTINLLNQYHSHQLVWHRQLTKTNQIIPALINSIAGSQAAANHKRDIRMTVRSQILNLLRKFLTTALLTLRIRSPSICLTRSSSATLNFSGAFSSGTCTIDTFAKWLSRFLYSAIASLKYFSFNFPTQTILIFILTSLSSKLTEIPL